MFDIKETDVLGQTNKLLFNIWQELKNRTIFIASQEAREEVKVVPLQNICPMCGKDHSNKGYALACARKHKKG
jgi:hypothetical protein